ncbi:hypothetical protein LZ575_12365 [Antarcticibacterium sp. 1MA-6-2]|uniref:DUF7282 domain-containing protein n=1 Tax=Antarcticibacterium sp. 1MA-6-2 TaxID=2908210 RepID=UPI001F3FE7D4|nr:hypothetical protein [Antarcticibacterium sp. 1MA-6-2]UJH89811.1 hypothetical protein LZ575_12365 [Antarcticibacterium sp. 1MA-6-2]
MKSLSNDLTRYVMYVVFSFMAVGMSSCSSDDDADDMMEPIATGSITVEDNQEISQNTLIVQSVTVGQESWVVAVMGGDENTNNFITEPVKVEAGTTTNVELILNDDVDLTAGDAGNEISIKLYANDQDEGNLGEWDESDDPIMDGDTMATETITVFVDDSSNQTFADFDANADGMLNQNEFPNSYQNNFSEWDVDGDGSLSDEEFSNTTFGNTDADDDDTISEAEWNMGWTRMYGTYT